MDSSFNMDLKLKQSFQSLFPEYASKLEKASSPEELNQLHNDFVKEQKKEFARTIGKDVSAIEVGEVEYNVAIALTNDQYLQLINAKGEDIKALLQTLLDGAKRIKEREHDEKGVIAAQMLLAGIIGIGPESIEGAMNYLNSLNKEKKSVVATDPALLAKELGVDQSMVVGFPPAEIIAGYAAIAALGSPAIIAYVVLLVSIVIISILIGLLIYFANKPAAAIVLFINELDKPVKFLSDHNIHGEPRLRTLTIRNGVYVPTIGMYPSAGFFATQKHEDALIGTQYGFTLKYGDTDTKFTFAVECPLAEKRNSCYCSFNEDPESAAQMTDKKSSQHWEAEQNGIKLSITCNSNEGSIAYYVARAYRE
ncbi:hypothetical protein [Bacillus siamensis]|uniref:hypothetical protein n=1 Tax=Bacillus siamensis TaxID=659243 RepID=UPI000646559D|nr:hypothetical protein [Bacillus siamensis]